MPPGRAAWVREEALASILSVAMLELPVSKMQAQLFQDQNGGEKKDQNVASALISRISMQVSYSCGRETLVVQIMIKFLSSLNVSLSI